MSNEVKFSAETIGVFKKLSKINQGLKIVGGNKELRSLNENKTIAAYINIEEELPRDFCIYDLGEWITVLGIIENPIADFTNPKFVLIKSENSAQKLKYVDGQENLITSYSAKNFVLPSEDVKLSVSAAQLKSVLGAATALKLDYVGFKADGKTVTLAAFNKNNGSGDDTNGFSIEVGESAETFELFYKTESLGILDGDSVFSISKKKISEITNGKAKYFVALDANSSFV